MAAKFIPFEDVEALATIDQLATMLNLDIKRSGAQFRCECPVHGGDHRTLAISPQVRSKRGSLGVFFCQQDKSGGDRIGLVAHCMELGQQDAAFFIAQQFGMEIANSRTVTSTGTVPTVSKSPATPPPAQQKAPQKAADKPLTFDPAAFAAKLSFTDEVAALGFSEEDAERLQIGFYRGRVYLPMRHKNGDISGFIGYANGELKLPPKWLEPQEAKVLRFPKTA
jgi:hypothetical protein